MSDFRHFSSFFEIFNFQRYSCLHASQHNAYFTDLRAVPIETTHLSPVESSTNHYDASHHFDVMATGNRFDLLDDEVSMKRHSSPSLVLEDAVSYAVAAASGVKTDYLMSAGKTGHGREKASSPQQSHDDDAKISMIVAKVMAAIQPILVQTVSAAVAAAMKSLMDELKKPLQSLHQLETDGQQAKALEEVDRLEQYGRRDNIRIFGLEETRGEDTTNKVVELAADMGLAISANDISVSHRLPTSGRRSGSKKTSRPIIVKFVRRSTKQAVMKNKKELRRKENRKNVYVEEDLTPLRNRIVRALREDSAVKTVWSIDGRIFAIRKKGGKEEKVVIDSGHDLRKLDWTTERIHEITRH